jgi:GNAT superfamily N-acetyltransferase
LRGIGTLAAHSYITLNIQIREADLDRDGVRIADALSKYLTPLADLQRFDWLYNRNPNGKARAWVGLIEGDLVATAAVFPRRAYFNKSEIIAWVLGDFCVSDRHRSLGPAVALQRALLHASDSNGIPVSYDFPSAAMRAVYKRLQLEPFGQMVRMAKVLRLDRKFREHIRYGPLSKTLTPIGNALLSATAAFRPAVDRTLKISLQEGKCGGEFDALARRVGISFEFCVRRSAEYLNWRYLENPYKKHGLMKAERDGELLGFLIFSQTGADGEIVDVFAEDNSAILGRLINEVVELFRRRGVMTVSVELIASHPWIGLFKKFGFYSRENKPLMVYASNQARPLVIHNGGSSHSAWFITGGDRDS